MLKIKNKYRCFMVWIFLTAYHLASFSHAATLKVCYDQWVPMTIFPSDGSPDRGIVIDMIDHIYKSKGYTLEYYEVPLARGLDMVADGACDMLPEYLFSEESEKRFVYATEETFTYTTAFVVRKDDPWIYKGIESIKGKRIATGPGWDYSSMGAHYQNYIDDPINSKYVEVIAGNDDVVDRIFHMIKDNRVDLYVDNKIVLQHVLNRLGLNEYLKIVEPGLENEMVEIPIFSKAIPFERRREIIKIWDEGRIFLRGDSEKLLLDKYNVAIEN